jgi:putative ATP-binding cassette transporter
MIKYYLAKRKRQVILATMLSAVSALLSTALLAYLNNLAAAGFSGGFATIGLYAFGLVGLMFAANVIAQTYLARYGAVTVAELRRSLSERFLHMDYQKLQALGKHVISGSLIMDVSQLATLFQVLPLFFFQAMTLIFCLAYLAYLSLKLLAIFVVFLTVAVLTSRRLGRMFGAQFMQVRNEQDKLFAYFGALSDGKKELSLSRARRRHFLDHVIQPSIDRSRELAYSAQKLWSYNGAWSTTMTFCALFSVVYAGNVLFALPSVTIMQAFIVCTFVMNPVNFLMIASRDIRVGITSAKKLAELGVASGEPTEGDEAPAPPPAWRTISACGLQHRYNEADRHGFAFGPLDLSVHRGETLFVVGGNGSGKSTLALLLCGLLRPVSGHLEIDGAPVFDATSSAYRQLFSGVFFDFHLFRHIIDREGSAPSDAAVNELLRKLDLHEKVQVAGGELSTLNLSQGQRKRLALVQSYVDDAEIFLFDEWAADQDPEFKRYFYRELLPELKRRGKTAIVITHDDRYFDCADRIVKLDQGRIAPLQTDVSQADVSDLHAVGVVA